MRALAPLRLAMVLTLALLAGACTRVPATAPPERLAFAGTVALDVAEVLVEDRYAPPLTRPNVEHRFTVPPAEGVRQWAAQRLRAVGTQGQLLIVIRDASVVEDRLPTDRNLQDVFTQESSESYTGRVVIEVRAELPQLITGANVEIQARKTVFVPEGATLEERERIWYTLTRDLVQALDTQWQAALGQSFSELVAVQ